MKIISMSLGILFFLFVGNFFFGIPIIPQSFASTNITAIPLQRTIPKNGVNVPVLSLVLQTKEKPIQIEEIHIRRTGLSSHSDVEGVRAQTKNRRSRRTPMLSDDIAKIQMSPSLEIPANTREQIIITANFQFKESYRTIGFALEKIITTQENSKLHITQKEDQKAPRTQSIRYQRMPKKTYSIEPKTKKPSYRKTYRYRGSRNYKAL